MARPKPSLAQRWKKGLKGALLGALIGGAFVFLLGMLGSIVQPFAGSPQPTDTSGSDMVPTEAGTLILAFLFTSLAGGLSGFLIAFNDY